MLIKLATLLLAAKLYAHAAHNKITGAAFFADHEFLGDVYGKLDSDYDAVIERAIGLATLGVEIDPIKIALDAATLIQKTSLKTCEEILTQLDQNEKSIREEIGVVSDGQTYGTQNLLAAIADASEVRSYKIKQRLAV